MTYNIIFVKGTDFAMETETIAAHTYAQNSVTLLVCQGEGEKFCGKPSSLRTEKKEERDGAPDLPGVLDQV